MVRQALAELDSWEVQSKFILIEQQDSLGKSLTVVKDFKELLNKVLLVIDGSDFVLRHATVSDWRSSKSAPVC